MTRSTHVTDELSELAAARPVDEDGWADSPIGQAVLARSQLLANNPVPSGRRSRRRIVVSLAGAGVAWAFTNPHGSASRSRDLSVVLCADAFTLHADLTEAEDPQQTAAGAIAGCTRYWQTTGGGAVPPNLVSCVYPAAPDNDGGGRAVFPAPAGLPPSSAPPTTTAERSVVAGLGVVGPNWAGRHRSSPAPWSVVAGLLG